jgi:hypothetical protein
VIWHANGNINTLSQDPAKGVNRFNPALLTIAEYLQGRGNFTAPATNEKKAGIYTQEDKVKDENEEKELRTKYAEKIEKLADEHILNRNDINKRLQRWQYGYIISFSLNRPRTIFI